MDPIVGCPICDCRSRPLLWGTKCGFDLTRCPRCGVGRTAIDEDFDPRGIYSEGYFRGEHHDGYADYVGSREVVCAESRASLQALMDAGCRGGRLLEIGCAYGFFLEIARETFSVSGVELCEAAAQACRDRGLDVETGELTDQFLRERPPFQAAAMFDVIEHLPDPLETLQKLAGSLEPGAHLIITTGDWGSCVARCMGSRWRLLTPPQHLFFFTARSLTMLLHRAGFRVVSIAHPAKRVSLGLIAYQLQRIVGMKPTAVRSLNRFAVPVNLFDAFRVIAVFRGGASNA